jgi:hypothetical protein
VLRDSVFDDADVEAAGLRQFYRVRGAKRATGNAGAWRAKLSARPEVSFVKNQSSAIE